MPNKIKSKAQQRFLYATHPELAKEMAGNQSFKNLPERLHPKKKQSKQPKLSDYIPQMPDYNHKPATKKRNSKSKTAWKPGMKW